MLRRPSIPYVAGYFHMTLVLFRADYLIAESGSFFQRCLRGIHYPDFRIETHESGGGINMLWMNLRGGESYE